MNKKHKLLLVILVVLVFVMFAYIIDLHNVLLSTLFYPEQYRLETSEKTEILEAFHKIYPNSTIRYSPIGQIPVIIYEVQNNNKEIMFTGTFYTGHPIFVFRCTEEYTSTRIFYDIVTEPTYFENRFCH